MATPDLVSMLVISIGGPAGVGAIFFWLLRGLVNKIEKIQPLEQRIVVLEAALAGEQAKNDKTAEEVIRMSEQVKFLTQEVRRMADFITQKYLGVQPSA